MNNDTLSNQIRTLAVLKAEKKRLAEDTKNNNGEIDMLERDIISAMLDLSEDAGLSSVDDFTFIVDGRRYGVNTRPIYSIRAEDREMAFPLLREVGLGDLIQERVDDRTLSKTMVDIVETAGGVLPDEYTVIPMSRYDKQTISDRKVGR